MREYIITVSFSPRDIEAVRDALGKLQRRGVAVTIVTVEVRDGQ